MRRKKLTLKALFKARELMEEIPGKVYMIISPKRVRYLKRQIKKAIERED